MANSQKNNKKLIIGICSIVAVVAIIAVIVIIITMRGGFGPAINDNYFVTDNSKYVITLDEKQTDEDINAEKTHIVYNYSGNNITSVKYYYEFTDDATAKNSYNSIKDSIGELYKSIELNGKYIILTLNEADFEGMTTDDVKQQIEFMDLLDDMNFDENSEVTIEGSVDAGEVVPEEGTEE